MKYCPFCGKDLTNIPSEEKEVPENRSQKPVASILGDYVGKNDLPDTYKGVPVAKPEYLDNKARLLRLASMPMPILKIKNMDGEMSKFGDLAIGEGIQQEF